MKLILQTILILLLIGCSKGSSSRILIDSIELSDFETTDFNLNVLYIKANVACKNKYISPMWFLGRDNLLYPQCPIFEYDSIDKNLKINAKYLDKTVEIKKLNTVVLIDYFGTINDCGFSADYRSANGYLYLNDTIKVRTVDHSAKKAFRIITTDSEIYLDDYLGNYSSGTLNIEYNLTEDLEISSKLKNMEIYTFNFFKNVDVNIYRTGYKCL